MDTIPKHGCVIRTLGTELLRHVKHTMELSDGNSIYVQDRSSVNSKVPLAFYLVRSHPDRLS